MTSKISVPSFIFKFDIIGLTFPFKDVFNSIITVVPFIEYKNIDVSPKSLIPEITWLFEVIIKEVNNLRDALGVPVNSQLVFVSWE